MMPKLASLWISERNSTPSYTMAPYLGMQKQQNLRSISLLLGFALVASVASHVTFNHVFGEDTSEKQIRDAEIKAKKDASLKETLKTAQETVVDTKSKIRELEKKSKTDKTAELRAKPYPTKLEQKIVTDQREKFQARSDALALRSKDLGDRESANVASRQLDAITKYVDLTKSETKALKNKLQKYVDSKKYPQDTIAKIRLDNQK